jgi:tetratricopeptide (TPR) repeat protein
MVVSEPGRQPGASCAHVRRGRAVARLALASSLAGLLSLSVSGCASLRSGLERTPSSPARAERPDLPADYDVLIGEMLLRDGEFEAARQAFERGAEKDPEAAYIELQLSRISAQLEDLGSAIEHAARAVALDPDNEESRLLLGGLYRIARDAEGAESVLLREDGLPFSDSSALLMHHIYLESDRYSDAVSILEDLIVRDPEVIGAYMALASAYERMGQPAAAEQILRRGLEVYPDRFVLYSRLSRLKRNMGDRLGEIAVYREVLESTPHHYGSLLSLGEALVAANDLDAAIEVYAEIVEHYPNDMKALRRLASLEFAAGRPEQASMLLEDGLARFPESKELAFSLGQVRHGMGDLDGAMQAFGEVAVSDRSYFDARTQIIAIYEEREDYESALREINALREVSDNQALDFHAAGLFLRNGDFDSGYQILAAMLEENPEDEEALYQLGVLYGMAKRMDLAVETMQRVLEINPDNAHALNYVGYSWAEHGENLDQAEEMITRALVQRPNDGFIADSLGWVYYKRGQRLLGTVEADSGLDLLRRARDQLVLAAQLTGGDPVVSEHLGDVYFLLDQKERAYQFYQEAVDMGHREDEQPDLLEKLRKLQLELETQ